MKKLIDIIVLALALAGCLLLYGCADSKADSSTGEQYTGTYNIYDEDGADLGTTVVFGKDGITASYMHGNYDFIKKGKKMQIVMAFEANKDDPAVFDIERVGEGYILEEKGDNENPMKADLEFVSGRDGINKGSAFSGVYSIKNQDETRYIFEDDKTVDLKTSDVWSADGEEFVWGKAKYRLSVEKDNDTIKSMTIKAEDGTAYIMNPEQD